eukprot:TRINITY_DN2072_c0_g1_i7.p1 TRINITY_DN2072_c0_g1~~TRINITY_DN2072_c0_g1_i7.p1  ORF type:complete len:191 (+),score=22.80 TRINITY_DN2072_c0_g1_i7:70-642(+)
MLQALVRAGATHVSDHVGNTALHCAIRALHAEAVLLLIQLAVPVNTPDMHGRTPLMQASQYGHELIIRILLQNHADPLSTDPEGNTALFWAAKHGKQAAIRVLLLSPNVMVHINHRNGAGQTALHKAVESGHVGSVQALLEAGASLAVRDAQGWTPLEWAKQRQFVSLVELLHRYQFQQSRNSRNSTFLP